MAQAATRKSAPGWEYMLATNEGHPKLEPGKELSLARMRVSLVSDGGSRWAWNCPYKYCTTELQGEVGGFTEIVEAQRDAHLAERHGKRARQRLAGGE